jgi:ketosteroid isomerase-like protein
MRTALLTLVIALSAVPALASDKTDVMATVKAYVDATNKGEDAAGAALCANPAAVIDDFAPHVWQGPTACADWAAAFAADAKASGDTEALVTTAKPLHLTVKGDRAYAVLPAKYAYKEHGKPIVEPGLWTFALQKLDAGWRITGWTWSGE